MRSKAERTGVAPPSIVLVIGCLLGGGAERVLSDMANYWARKGWSIVIATWSSSEVNDFYEIDSEVNRVWLGVSHTGRSAFGKLKFNFSRIVRLRSLLAELEPDAVLSFINTSNVLTILATAGLKTKVVVSERVEPAADPRVSLGWRLLRRLFYPYSDEIVAQSKASARWIRRNISKEPIVIPNPLRSLPDIVCERQSLVVAVGSLTNQKGFDLLIRAFARIATDFSDWNVAIVGDGKERGNLLRLRDELLLTDRVQFVGQVRNVESWMARAGLVVQPSRYEGFPNVVLESMGMGAPVVCADCPSGPADLIQDGVNGRLVPVEDITSLARVMAELIADPRARNMLGREASNVRRRYRQDRIMSRWEECLLQRQ